MDSAADNFREREALNLRYLIAQQVMAVEGRGRPPAREDRDGLLRRLLRRDEEIRTSPPR